MTATELPRLADIALVPAAAVAAAFLIAGLVVLGIGENPLTATRLLIAGSLGSGEALGFTLFYATNFIFTGLADIVDMHNTQFLLYRHVCNDNTAVCLSRHIIRRLPSDVFLFRSDDGHCISISDFQCL